VVLNTLSLLCLSDCHQNHLWRVNELFVYWEVLSVMAVSFFVMGQKLTQFGSSDVEVEVGVKVLNALADTASHSHVSCGSTNQ